MNSATLQSLLLLAALGLPLLAALALTIASWRGVVMRATPVAAVPALLLVFAGQNGASLHLPSLGQHAVLGLDAVGRIFLGFTSVLWLTSGWYARAYLAKDLNPVRFHFLFLVAMTGHCWPPVSRQPRDLAPCWLGAGGARMPPPVACAAYRVVQG